MRNQEENGMTNEEPPQEPVEERVNLHHTLKDLQHSASKAVKDMHKYIHQQLNTVAKTSVEKVGKPLATVVLGPAILMKETLDALAGKRRPPPEEAISSWCPSCTENDNFDQTQTQFRPQSNPQIPCYEPNCHDSNEPDHTNAENSPPSQDAFDQETKKQQETPFISHKKPYESDLVYPNESNSGSKRGETNVDIRFGNVYL